MAGLAPSSGTDWTDHERGEIHRLEALCRKLGHWELECKCTDTGDPWCVVHDPLRDMVFLHIARIDRRYVVDWPALQRSVTVATIETAIDIALSETQVDSGALSDPRLTHIAISIKSGTIASVMSIMGCTVPPGTPRPPLIARQATSGRCPNPCNGKRKARNRPSMRQLATMKTSRQDS